MIFKKQCNNNQRFAGEISIPFWRENDAICATRRVHRIILGTHGSGGRKVMQLE